MPAWSLALPLVSRWAQDLRRRQAHSTAAGGQPAVSQAAQQQQEVLQRLVGVVLTQMQAQWMPFPLHAAAANFLGAAARSLPSPQRLACFHAISSIFEVSMYADSISTRPSYGFGRRPCAFPCLQATLTLSFAWPGQPLVRFQTPFGLRNQVFSPVGAGWQRHAAVQRPASSRPRRCFLPPAQRPGVAAASILPAAVHSSILVAAVAGRAARGGCSRGRSAARRLAPSARRCRTPAASSNSRGIGSQCCLLSPSGPNPRLGAGSAADRGNG